MSTYPNIDLYYSSLTELIEAGGSDKELNIRPAFQNCLVACCASHRDKLVLVPELLAAKGTRPDGTVRDDFRMSRAYWEAKDSPYDLDAEIQAKFNQGYPRDNIIFEDYRTAALFQNEAEELRADMSRPADLHHLIRVFLDYELPEIGKFRQDQQQFKADLLAVLENLRQAVADAEAGNDAYREGVTKFLELCHQSIGPAVTEADVSVMLLNHILTQDIFLWVFGEDQFHRENNTAHQFAGLEQTLASSGQLLRRLLAVAKDSNCPRPPPQVLSSSRTGGARCSACASGSTSGCHCDS